MTVPVYPGYEMVFIFALATWMKQAPGHVSQIPDTRNTNIEKRN